MVAENTVNVRVRVDDDTKSGMRSVERSAEQGGKKAGDEFAKAFTKDANGRLHDERGRFVRAGREAGEAVADGAEDGADRGPFSGLLERGKGALLGAASAIGVAVGAAMLAGLQRAMEESDLAAQLRASVMNPADAELAGGAAGKVWAAGFGRELGDVQRAARLAIAGLGVGSKDIDYVTEAATNLATVFDVDVRESINAARSLLTSGLAKDAKQAMDIVTGAMQMGDLGDDMIDTINEYSIQFKELGLSAPMSLGLISQMMASGARNTDVAADALKEFAINAKDPKVASAYRKLGLDSEEMLKKMAAGGKGAAQGMGEIVAALKGVKDPVLQNALAFELFGTKSEDLQDALMAIDPKSAVEAFGDVGGAAGRMGDELEKADAQKVRKFQRAAMRGFTAFGAGVIDAFVSIMRNPDVKAFGKYWSEEIQPGLERFWKLVEKHVAPVLQDVLSGALEAVTDSLKDLKKMVKENEPELKSLAKWLGRVADAAGSDAAKMVGKVLVNGFVAMIRVTAVAVDIIGKLARTFRLIKRYAQPAIDWVKDKLPDLKSAASSVKTALGRVLRGFFHPLYEAVDGPVRWAKAKLRELLDMIPGVSAAASKAGKTIGKALAHGGVVGAATGGAHGGLRLVGEQGPELVTLPYGSTVHTAGDTARMLAQGPAEQRVVLEFARGRTRTEDLLLELMRTAVRVRGGNVQTVLGV